MFKYKGASVEKQLISTVPKPSNGTMWKLSGGFFAGAVLLAIIFYVVFYSSWEKTALVMILILSAVYTVSGIIIRRFIEIPLLKLIFCQSGGFINLIAIIVTLNALVFDMINYYSINVHFFAIDFPEIIIEFFGGYSMCFAAFCLPALEISLLFQAIIGLVMKKINSPKAVTEENIAENNE